MMATPRIRGVVDERENKTMDYLRRELKVCEGCGGLWVRTGVSAGIYCGHCGPRMAELPPRRRVRAGRPCRVERPGPDAKQMSVSAAGGAA